MEPKVGIEAHQDELNALCLALAGILERIYNDVPIEKMDIRCNDSKMLHFVWTADE